MQISSETQRYYDRNISIIPTADYIVVPSAKVELTTPGLNGTNTYATLKRVKDFVGDKSVIFCTQELYSYRAIYIANHLSLNMNVFCSDPIIYSDMLKSTIREYLAQVKAVLNCTLFTPSPASLETNSFYIYTEKEENFN